MTFLKSAAIGLFACALFSSAQAAAPGLGFKFFDDTSTTNCLAYGESLLNSFQFTELRVSNSYVSVRKGDVNIMIACGGTRNSLIVAGGAEASCVYNALLPYVDTRAINNGTPMNCAFKETSDVAQVDSNLNIHIPQAAYPDLGATTRLWVDLQFVPSDDGRLLWELSNAGVNE